MSASAETPGFPANPREDASAVHLLMRPDPATLADCRRFCREADTVVLLDTGVLSLALGDWQEGFAGGVAFACLVADALAHGVTDITAKQGVRLLEDADLVDLVMASRHCLSWK